LFAWPLLAALFVAASSASAQVSSYGDKQMGERADQKPALLDKVYVHQRLNQQLPLDAAFRDETANPTERYRYSVTAIDSKGNESPATTAVLEPDAKP